MEFHEKLQELRKAKGLTQEQLAEKLYVSRTAISKWESGRGYPNIDSLKEISKFFSVSIDDLLSSEKLLTIAEEENKRKIRKICGFLTGILDISTCLLMFLPLYPNPVGNHIYSVNLIAYTDTTDLNRMCYWGLYSLLTVIGIIKLILSKTDGEHWQKQITNLSMILGIFMVLFLAVTREAYATVFAFLLFLMKGILLFA